jgi:hypothetical protein
LEHGASLQQVGVPQVTEETCVILTVFHTQTTEDLVGKTELSRALDVVWKRRENVDKLDLLRADQQPVRVELSHVHRLNTYRSKRE